LLKSRVVPATSFVRHARTPPSPTVRFVRTDVPATFPGHPLRSAILLIVLESRPSEEKWYDYPALVNIEYVRSMKQIVTETC
jgi:hypothetical protein